MTGALALDWAIMAVSLFNTILLLWLGLTVLLNAERKSWGVRLTGGGLLTGGVFFISHSAILGRGLHTASRGSDFWWHVGWLPVILSPVAWYVVMLWYAGFWGNVRGMVRRRHRTWLVGVVALSAVLVGMLLFANPLPSYGQVVQLDLSAVLSVAGVPLMILLYPLYIAACILLSLDALRHAEPSVRVPGGVEIDMTRVVARRRARPWLMASTVVLLAVSLLVAGVMILIVLNARQRTPGGLYADMSMTVAWFDLSIASLIAVAVLLLGQAIVSYEVFTGETLPRRGFFRQWRSAILLAAGYSVVVGGSLVIQLRPIYALLLTTVLVAGFYALLNWRSFAERERTIDHLRPFAASQRLYESVLSSSAVASSEVDIQTLFRALCEDVLGAKMGYLVALGPLAPLVGAPLAYPADQGPGFTLLSSLSQVVAQFGSPQSMCVSLDPASHGGAVWAVSLWGERGLIGLLFLGEKGDGGLYTREEIEIARASGERLIDTQATAEMSRRLMALLRQRIAQVRVMEGQGRRVLHDQVLPQLHAAILYLGGAGDAAGVRQAVEALTGVHRQLSDLMRDTAPTAPHQLAEQGLVAALRASVEQDFGGDFDAVAWQVAPGAEQAARRLPLFVSEVVLFAALELVRNAARHGRGGDAERPLHLRISLEREAALCLTVEDDGVGFRTGSERASALPEDQGHGLQFHSTMLVAVGASMEVMALQAGGTRARITVSAGVVEGG